GGNGARSGTAIARPERTTHHGTPAAALGRPARAGPVRRPAPGLRRRPHHEQGPAPQRGQRYHRPGPPARASGRRRQGREAAADLLDPVSLSRRIIEGGELTRDEARDLFALEGEAVYDLFYAAHKVRRHFHGDRVTFCSILPTKFGNCSEDCKFCAQSGHYDTGITPHTMMEADEVAKACADSRDKGASAFGIVNSGRGPTQREWPKIMEAVQAMKDVDGICHCATLGRLTEDQARDLKAAGVRRINHNLETSKEFYPQIVTTHAWQERVDTVRLAQRVGLETCCGCIF